MTDSNEARFGDLADRLIREHPIVTGGVFKADCEINWLVGCTDQEIDLALATHRTGSQGAKRIRRGDTND